MAEREQEEFPLKSALMERDLPAAAAKQRTFPCSVHVSTQIITAEINFFKKELNNTE